MSEEFGLYLKERRGKDSLRTFANKLQISHSQLESLEKGFEIRTGRLPNITINLLNKLSQGLGITMPTLIKYFKNNPTFNKRKFAYERPKIYSPEVKAMILKDLEELGSITKVAQKYHISERTVSAIHRDVLTHTDRERIMEAYKKNPNAEHICSTYHIAEPTLRRWISETYPAEFKEQVLEYLRETKDLSDTAQFFDLSKQTISAWLRQTITPDRRKAILKELENTPIEEVAYNHNIAVNTIKRWSSQETKENFYQVAFASPTEN